MAKYLYKLICFLLLTICLSKRKTDTEILQAPETIFFIVALQSNNPRFAVGAVSGSSIGILIRISITTIFVLNLMRLDPSRLYNRIGNMRLHWCKNVSYKEF
jgi:hypothetical protein